MSLVLQHMTDEGEIYVEVVPHPGPDRRRTPALRSIHDAAAATP